MRHRVKKIKFNFGKDANKMLLRKLAVNFLTKGSLKTTLAKGKVLKSFLERLVSRMKVKSEVNKNYLIRYLGDSKLVENCFKNIGPVFSNVNGGYVRIIKLNFRSTDGAFLARLEWTKPVVLEKKEVKIKKLNKNEKNNQSNKTD